MGCCLSTPNPSNPPLTNLEPETPKPDTEPVLSPIQSKEIPQISDIPETEKKVEIQILEQEEKKEELLIQPRKSHDKHLSPEPQSVMAMAANGGVVRTSSCTKEEVDAILIQCGRLSRSSSANRKYSGSKRSHDFDKDHSSIPIELNCDENEDDERQKRRQSRGSHSNRRNASSRSRERDPLAQKSAGGTGRRLSRSPAKRSETSNNVNTSTTTTNSASNRPGKLVSVPATVTGEKVSNGGGNVKRVLVRRNVTPPRSRSPGVKNQNPNQPSPGRNLSRKTEHSPYRRTPLTDLDMNSLPFQPLVNSKSSSIKAAQRTTLDPLTSVSQSKVGGSNTLTRSRSSRRSRDLDVESLSKPATNYTSLLLQDIQNFHQKGSSSNTSTNSTSVPSFKLPECVSKACSIVEAVADLNLNSCSTRPVGRAGDDLMEPSLQKFVTVEKKSGIDEKEESSGSNSVAVVNGGGGQSQWVSSSASSWEHGSEGVSPASFQRLGTGSGGSRSGVVRTRAGNGR